MSYQKSDKKNVYVDYFFKYQQNYACVVAGKKSGVIDIAGNLVIPIQYDRVILPKNPDGWFVVSLKKKFGFVDRNHQIVIPLIYDWAEPFGDEGLAAVCKDGKFGFIDIHQNIIIPFEYSFANSFSQGLACVHNALGHKGYINTKGEEVISMRFGYADHFQQGLAMVETLSDKPYTGLSGMINQQGEEVIPCKYRDLFFISDDIIKAYSVNDKALYFDKKGNEIERFAEYQELNSFVNGYASVSKNGQYGLIDIQGNLIIPYKYSSTLVLEEGSDLVTTSKNSSSFGAFSLSTGREVIPFVYPYVANLGQNRYLVEDKSGRSRKLVDEQNNTIFESKHKIWNKYTPIYIIAMALIAYWFFFA